jgi:hypothetical protein
MTVVFAVRQPSIFTHEGGGGNWDFFCKKSSIENVEIFMTRSSCFLLLICTVLDHGTKIGN